MALVFRLEIMKIELKSELEVWNVEIDGYS